MPNRIIRESCLASPTLTALSDAGERFFWRLTTVADDYGRFDANLAVLNGRCVPTLNWSTKKVLKCLQEMTCLAAGDDEPLVRLYQVKGRIYGYFTKWTTHQRDRSQERNPPKSKFPDPKEGQNATLSDLPQSAASGGSLRPMAALSESEIRDPRDESRESYLAANGGGGPPPPPQVRTKKRPKEDTPWPDGFTFSEKHAALAQGLGLNVQREFARFRDKAQAKGWTYVDWEAAFRNWLNNEVEFKQARAGR